MLAGLLLVAAIAWPWSSDSVGASVALPGGFGTPAGSLACEALLETSIYPDGEAKRLETHSSIGTDRLAVEVNGSALRFITGASVKVGIATPAEFKILRNDNEVLVAVYYEGALPSSGIDSFVLNRANGLAVWTKSRPTSLSDKQPETQAIYFQCR